MISEMKLADKSYCTGCAACKVACPRNAISMRTDEEGFLYPYIDSSLCVKCGVCEKICPSLNKSSQREPIGVYAVNAKDDALRLDSSSGGVFSLLAKDVLVRGGVVFGAAFDRNDWHVYHKRANNEGALAELRGSKYAQSDVGESYRYAESNLRKGHDVLFTGTPCQIAGLRASLCEDYEKLLLVDVVCHAVPSPLVWKKYLEKRVASVYKNGAGGLREIRRIAYRRKNCRWKRFSMSLDFANSMEYRAIYSDDSFMRGFLAELYNRPSCHNCPAKCLSSGADITIADYWGVESRFPEMDDDKGTSLVLVNTDKGAKAFSALLDKVNVEDSDFEHAVAWNPAIVKSTTPHKNRQRFFRYVNNADFDLIVDRMLQPSMQSRIRTIGGRVLRKIGLRK